MVMKSHQRRLRALGPAGLMLLVLAVEGCVYLPARVAAEVRPAEPPASNHFRRPAAAEPDGSP